MRIENREELIEFYNKNINRANKRLRALEKLAENPEYKSVLDFQYKRTMRELPKGSKRFKKLKPDKATDFQIARANAILNEFLNAVSSTKSGIDSSFKKRAETISKQMGTDVTWHQLAGFFESQAWENLTKQFGSKTAVSVAGTIIRKHDDVLNEMKNRDNAISDEFENMLLQGVDDDTRRGIIDIFK